MSILRSIVYVVALWISFITVWMCVVPLAQENLNLQETNKLLISLDTPHKVWEFTKKFEYQFDRCILTEPKIKSPYLLLKDKKGDCKDFSNFAYVTGQFNSVRCRIYCIYPYPIDTGHAICIWKIGNRYYPLCNVTSTKSQVMVFSNLEDIWEWYRVIFKWKKIGIVRHTYPLPFMMIPLPDISEFTNDKF